MKINSLVNLIKSNKILYFLAYPIIFIRRLILKMQDIYSINIIIKFFQWLKREVLLLIFLISRVFLK